MLVVTGVAGAQANSAAGLVLTPATFSILNPSVFGDNSAVVVGGSYGNRPKQKTYLFSASLSHVRFQFGRTSWPELGRGPKTLATGLDYANGFGVIGIRAGLDLVSGIEGSIGYGLINYMDGTGVEGLTAGVITPLGARLFRSDLRVTPYVAPGLFFTRESLVGFGCGSPDGCPFASNGLRLTLGAGVRVEVLRRLLIEAGVRKTQTANAISRQSVGIAYRFGNIDGHGLRDAGSFTLEMDNDFLARTSKLLDEDYTQGFHFSFNRRSAPHVLESIVGRLARCSDSCTTSAAALAGQEIYTPQYFPEVQPGDRPFGGWLYGGVKSSIQSERAQTSISFKLGVTGKPSLAEQLQVTFHQLSPEYLIPPGWENQLRAEPGIVVSLEKKNLFEAVTGPVSAGVLTMGAASIGNILTDAEADLTIRAGLNDRHQWVATRQSNFGVHGSFGLRQDLVLRNLFLDGNTFRSGPRVHRIPLVWQKEVGAGLTMGPIVIDYRKTVRSKEFTTGRRYHPYGTISITRRGLF